MADTPSFTRILALGLLTSQAAAHGYVQGIIADGVVYQGYRPSFQYQTPPPQVPGWSDPANLDNGYINDYTSPDIICHLSATPGQTYATVQAGGSVELQWTPWPTGHLGPVITYLANCNGDCTNVDKGSLLFNKIDEKGLIQGGYSPGRWAADELIANNNSWTLTIPSTIAPGNYVLRHEIIALQEAQYAGGAQSYPQCVNIQVTGSGTDSLQNGTKGTQLYTSQDPGILINIYQALSGYIIPGPPLLGGAGNGTQLGLKPTTTVPFPNATSTTGLYLNTSTTVPALVTTAASTTASTLLATTATSNFTTLATSTTTTATTQIEVGVITSLTGAAFFAAPTTLQTSTRSDTSSSPIASQTLEYVGAYGGATITVTVTDPGVFATASTNTTLAWKTGTGYPIINSTAYPTGTLTGSRPHSTIAASATWTGTATGSSYLLTGTGTPYGFVGVPIDNGFKRRSARQFFQERR